jgi:hypothetical protein
LPRNSADGAVYLLRKYLICEVLEPLLEAM